MSEKQAIGGLGHDNERLPRGLLLLGVGAVLEPVIAGTQSNKEDYSERRLKIFGEFHRRSFQS